MKREKKVMQFLFLLSIFRNLFSIDTIFLAKYSACEIIDTSMRFYFAVRTHCCVICFEFTFESYTIRHFSFLTS